MMKNCCSDFMSDFVGDAKFELVKIEKTKNICPMCEDFAKEQIEKKHLLLFYLAKAHV